MFDLKKEWSISFAGCGFMGIYYVGATSCILERFPRFIRDASRVYGSSAGALMAAVLTTGTPLEKCCASLMIMAREARRRTLGPLHPAFHLLQMVQDSMTGSLPEDAHVRASGKLCVSLTRASDGKNVLVSEFASREELIQALACSCFVPFYCGVIPPTYRGVHYVDGAASDNLPRCHLKNTVTFSAYAGESDVCPPASSLSFHEVRFNNVSIHVSSENVYRVTSTFFPPKPEEMSEICQSGYMDALRFLRENNLIDSEDPPRSPDSPGPAACCELAQAEQPDGSARRDGRRARREKHFWLDPRFVENLPVNIRKALCEACRESYTADGLRIPRALPGGSARSLAQRLVNWIPVVPKDVSWLYDMAENMYRRAWKDRTEEDDRCTSPPLGLNMWSNTKEEEEESSAPLLTPEATPTSSLTFTWTPHREVDHVPLTPPPTPTPPSGPASGFEELPEGAGGGWGLGRAVGWIRNRTGNGNAGDPSSFSEFK